MRLDIGLYKGSKQIAQDWYRREGHKDPIAAVSGISMLTGVPCIVSAYWIGEIDNWPPRVIKSIKGLIKFYGYTEILNPTPGAPPFEQLLQQSSDP